MKTLLHRLLRRHRAAERFTLDRAAAAERLARLDSHDSPSLFEPTDLQLAAAARALLALLDGADLASEARELVDARELVEVALACLLSTFLQIESAVERARFNVVSGRTIGELLDAVTALGGEIGHDTLSPLTERDPSADVASLAVRRFCFLPDRGPWMVRSPPPPRSLFAQIARRLFG
jgi:hypothetical protein